MSSTLTAEQIMDYWPNFIRVARKVLPFSDQAVWEDVAGAAVERAFRSAHRFEQRDGGSPYGWLATIARRAAIDYRQATVAHEIPQADPVMRGATTDAGSDRHADMIDVRRALAALPPSFQPYAAARSQDLDSMAAGASVGMPRATTSRREHEMRALLRGQLNP